GLHPHADVGFAGRAWRPRSRRPRAPHPDGPPRRAGGDGRARRLPPLGRRELHHRADPGRRRRLERLAQPHRRLRAQGRRRMSDSIERAEVIVCSPGRNFVTLRLTTAGGLVGLGDATLNGRELATAAYLEQHLVPLLSGRDPDRIEDTWQYLYVGG